MLGGSLRHANSNLIGQILSGSDDSTFQHKLHGAPKISYVTTILVGQNTLVFFTGPARLELASSTVATPTMAIILYT
jgi:hypothetical protein